MIRAILIVGTLLLLASLGVLAALLTLGPSTPSILLFTMDTTRADRLPLFGGPLNMPALSALADGGLVFEQAYAVATESGPSHAAMLTGLTPERHGVFRNADELLPGVVTVAEKLQGQGYRTAAFIGDDLVGAQSHLDRGFDDFTLVEDPAHLPRAPTTASALRLYAQAAEYVAAHPKGLFLWVHAQAPHADYRPPLDYERLVNPEAERDDAFEDCFRELRREVEAGRPPDGAVKQRLQARYDGELAVVDSGLGLVLDAFARAGALHSLAIIATADHGETLLDRTEQRAFGHAFHFYEEVVHVPLVVRAPGVPGGRVPGYVLNTQIAATVEDLAQLPPERRGEATSLLAVARLGHGLGAFPLLAWPWGHGRHGARQGQWKLLAWDDGGVRLYDEAADPGELTDVSARHPEVVEALAPWLPEPARPDGGGELSPQTRELLRRGGYLREGGTGDGR